jgi:hypothetical protein
MTADTITLSSLDDLADLLLSARNTVRRVRLQSESGEMTTAEAAEIIRDTAKSISRAVLNGGDKCPSSPSGQNIENGAGEPEWEGGEYV